MLEVRDLEISFAQSDEGSVVKSVSFTVSAQEVVAVVGESGSGKSLTALALAGLLPHGSHATGEILFNHRILQVGKDEDWVGVRGKEMGIIFQDPASSLNPLQPVGKQIIETLQYHKKISHREAEAATKGLFAAMGIKPASHRLRQYPHQLSGGLKQRVMLAAAICCEPQLLIADEPTTALDVTVQAQILRLLQDYVSIHGTSLLIISHDLGVIAQLADRVLVMCAGQIVESAQAVDLFTKPAHPYTRLLLASVPRLDRKLVIPEMPTAENSFQLAKTEGNQMERPLHLIKSPPALTLRGEGLNPKSKIKTNVDPVGCVFASRCCQKKKICLEVSPPCRMNGNHGLVRCHE